MSWRSAPIDQTSPTARCKQLLRGTTRALLEGETFLSRAEDDNPSPGEEKTEACPELVSQAHTSKA